MRKLLQNKGIFIVLVVFSIVALADLLSTLAVGLELVKHLEANPVYRYIGLPGIVIVNILYIYLIYKAYMRSKITTRFFYMNLIVTTILVRIIVINSNIHIAMNPPPIELAMQLTTEMKTKAYIRIGSMAILPFLSGVLSFLFYKLDHSIESK